MELSQGYAQTVSERWTPRIPEAPAQAGGGMRTTHGAPETGVHPSAHRVAAHRRCRCLVPIRVAAFVWGACEFSDPLSRLIRTGMAACPRLLAQHRNRCDRAWSLNREFEYVHE